MNIFLDTYVSIIDEIISPANMNKENMVCLNISNFIFSFLLSAIIEL